VRRAAAYSPALTDWTIMVKEQGQMFLTGPDIVKAATGEVVTAEDIGASTSTPGSAASHTSRSTARKRRSTRPACLLSFLPTTRRTAEAAEPGAGQPRRGRAPARLVPERSSVVFDMNALLDGVLDNGARLELMPTHAPSILTLFARLDGHAVGILANQPMPAAAFSTRRGGQGRSLCRVLWPVRPAGADLRRRAGFLPGTVEESRGHHHARRQAAQAYVETDLFQAHRRVRRPTRRLHRDGCRVRSAPTSTGPGRARRSP